MIDSLEEKNNVIFTGSDGDKKVAISMILSKPLSEVLEDRSPDGSMVIHDVDLTGNHIIMTAMDWLLVKKKVGTSADTEWTSNRCWEVSLGGYGDVTSSGPTHSGFCETSPLDGSDGRTSSKCGFLLDPQCESDYSARNVVTDTYGIYTHCEYV